MKSAIQIFSTRSYAYLADSVCKLNHGDRGVVEVQIFPDGERYQRVITAVSDRHVALIGGTISDGDTLEMYDLASGLVQCGARSLLLIIPYFGYSTMERPVKGGDVVTAKARARLLSSIPMAIEGNRVVLVDLHSDGIPYYFESDIHPIHIYAKPLIVAAARRCVAAISCWHAPTPAARSGWSRWPTTSASPRRSYSNAGSTDSAPKSRPSARTSPTAMCSFTTT